MSLCIIVFCVLMILLMIYNVSQNLEFKEYDKLKAEKQRKKDDKCQTAIMNKKPTQEELDRAAVLKDLGSKE